MNNCVKHSDMFIVRDCCLNIIAARQKVQQMSNNLKIGIALVAALFTGGAIAGYKKLSKKGKQIDVKTLELILLEIKYQMFTYCFSFVDVVKNILSKIPNDEEKRSEIREGFKQKILEAFEDKQRLILLRYAISKDDLEKALDKPENLEPAITKLSEEIETLMLDALAGKMPDINLPEETRKKFPVDVTFGVFREMLAVMLEQITQAFQKEVESNPDFNCNDPDQFLKVIREVQLFQIKRKFLTEKGFKPANLCPNQGFARLLEQYKRKDKEFFAKIKELEEIYENKIESLTTNFENTTKQSIREDLNAVKFSKEVQAELFKSSELPDQPVYYRQASSNTERLSKWVHADKKIAQDIAQAVKGGHVQVERPVEVVPKKDGAEMLGVNVQHEVPKPHQEPEVPKPHEEPEAPKPHQEPEVKREEPAQIILPEAVAEQKPVEKVEATHKQQQPVHVPEPEAEKLVAQKHEEVAHESPNEDNQDKVQAETNEPESAQKDEEAVDA